MMKIHVFLADDFGKAHVFRYGVSRQGAAEVKQVCQAEKTISTVRARALV